MKSIFVRHLFANQDAYKYVTTYFALHPCLDSKILNYVEKKFFNLQFRTFELGTHLFLPS